MCATIWFPTIDLEIEMPESTELLPIVYAPQVFRPPSEADSLIFQVTLGCSWNRCTFCAMYRNKNFRVRPLEEVKKEIRWAKENVPEVRKVFLGDGDALIARADFLGEICDFLQECFPDLRRISCYASPQALLLRSVEEMAELRKRGLSLYYLGVESGDDAVLADLEKGVDSKQMIAAGQRAHEAGVKLSTMILLNAGGRALSQQHARGSAEVINAIQPKFVSTLVMTPTEGAPLAQTAAEGKFEVLSPVELAAELREFLSHLNLSASIFRSNHASNWLALAGNLPRDREAMVQALDLVLADPEHAPFRPAWARGL